jgi:hypothetical protein
VVTVGAKINIVIRIPVTLITLVTTAVNLECNEMYIQSECQVARAACGIYVPSGTMVQILSALV